MRRLALLLTVAIVATAPALIAPAAAATGVTYEPPVDRPVVDPFREPDGPYGPGNRGIDYDTEPGEPVGAAADGEVTFAGPVGSTLHVTVLHPDGIRTTYSFLRSVSVRRGEGVHQGQTVGTAGETLHFGARLGTTYVDPATLFEEGPPQVHLVPDEIRQAHTEAVERKVIADYLRRQAAGASDPGFFSRARSWIADRAADAGRFTVGWARVRAHRFVQEARGALHYTREIFVGAVEVPWRTLATIPDWWRQRSDCTPRSAPAPTMPERRMVVLVGGFGASSESTAVNDVDVAGLGYDPADTVRFSYLGGSADENPYGVVDTTVDLRESARLFRELLEEVAAANPGVPIDVVAHSQGGLVARQALSFEHDEHDRRLPPVANLVTLATPHRGTDLATAFEMLDYSMIGRAAQWAYSHLSEDDIDPNAQSLRQMSELSAFIRDLNRRELPDSIDVTSIASRGDLLVAAGKSHVDGARNVIVDVPGALGDHDALPGSSVAHREMALALGGAAAGCQSLAEMMTDTFVSEVISQAEDFVGAGVYVGAEYLDRYAKGPVKEKARGAMARRKQPKGDS